MAGLAMLAGLTLPAIAPPLAWASPGPNAYVANGVSNNVSAIDTATNTVVGNPIPVGNNPLDVAITPNGQRAYVTNVGSNNVSVIDTTTNTVVGNPIPVGSLPTGVAITPNGQRAYVTNGVSNNVSVIDTTTNTVVGNPIPVGNSPFGVAITPNGQRAYVTNTGSNNVSVIDTTTNTVVGNPIPVGNNPLNVAITPNGQRAYVTNEQSNSVSVINTATNTVVGSPIPVGNNPFGIAIAPASQQKPSLTIAKSLTGEFTRGNRGTYTITVGNTGPGTTDGTTVTVRDTLPRGLTADRISGSGWNCTRSTLTCTRRDALLAGSSYPPITLTVRISCSAPARVTNNATVTGGGDTTTHTATAPTTINPDRHCGRPDHR
ncbi:YncE family protein [Streptomyces sp. NPDC059832]|uniref:YncE family protein n=1 Tax=Streptomyces sp. NPDC059832 TaxID=3346966 RepID=UPI00364DAFD4